MRKSLVLIALCFFLTNCSTINNFGFGKKKTDFEKYKINEYLWLSSKNLLTKYQGTKSNLQDGFIQTGWIIPKKESKTRFRIVVYIVGSDLLEENLEVFVEKEININGQWVRKNLSDSLKSTLKREIINGARNLDSSN